METKTKSKILCVDDEPNVLEGIALSLRRRYDIVSATSGVVALDLVAQHPDIAVVISDMRMPAMDGSTFLMRMRKVAPDAVRILLTGQTDMDSAISAVNEGQIFRFLTKPCAPPALLSAVAVAVEQHRLLTAERVLLEQTLHGCIKTLTDVLSLTNPIAFGRATRIQTLVTALATKLELQERWQLEVAAMLSQLGHITLPPEVAEKVYFAQALTPEEQELVERAPGVAEELLRNIPRMEVIREILASYRKPLSAAVIAPDNLHQRTVQYGSRVLRVAVDFDAIESQGYSAAHTLDTLRGRAGCYAGDVIVALEAIRGGNVPMEEVRELPASALRAGMVFAEDVKLPNGTLLAARGYEITPRFLERIGNSPKGSLKSTLRVILRGSSAGS